MPIPHYVGRISYSLYLMHGVVFSAAWFLMPLAKAQWGVPSAAERWLYAVGFVAVSFAGAHVTYHQVEVPMRNFLTFQKLRVTASSARSRSN